MLKDLEEISHLLSKNKYYQVLKRFEQVPQYNSSNEEDKCNLYPFQLAIKPLLFFLQPTSHALGRSVIISSNSIVTCNSKRVCSSFCFLSLVDVITNRDEGLKHKLPIIKRK